MKTPEQRLKERLSPPNPITGCVEWTGYRDGDGYGIISTNHKNDKAHRLAFSLKRGPIPEGMCVCHTCDNPPCCNEDHLFLGTKAQNSEDMVRKGRSAKRLGFKNHQAKLTEEDVVEIRRRLDSGESARRIADAFKVSDSTVCRIKKGKLWNQTPNVLQKV